MLLRLSDVPGDLLLLVGEVQRNARPNHERRVLYRCPPFHRLHGIGLGGNTKRPVRFARALYPCPLDLVLLAEAVERAIAGWPSVGGGADLRQARPPIHLEVDTAIRLF